MYEIFPGNDKKWYWHLKAANGEIIAQGQGYTTKQACIGGIEAVNNRVKEPTAFETFEGSDKKWYWHLKAANGEPIAQGQGYATKAACLKGIEVVTDQAQTDLALDLSIKSPQGGPAIMTLNIPRR